MKKTTLHGQRDIADALLSFSLFHSHPNNGVGTPLLQKFYSLRQLRVFHPVDISAELVSLVHVRLARIVKILPSERARSGGRKRGARNERDACLLRAPVLRATVQPLYPCREGELPLPLFEMPPTVGLSLQFGQISNGNSSFFISFPVWHLVAAASFLDVAIISPLPSNLPRSAIPHHPISPFGSLDRYNNLPAMSPFFFPSLPVARF